MQIFCVYWVYEYLFYNYGRLIEALPFIYIFSLLLQSEVPRITYGRTLTAIKADKQKNAQNKQELDEFNSSLKNLNIIKVNSKFDYNNCWSHINHQHI